MVSSVEIAIGLTLVLVIVLIAMSTGNGSLVGSSTGGSGTLTPMTPITPLAPIPPFTGWATGGNQYVIDYGTQHNLSGWQGVMSNDANPIACPNQTLLQGVCATDLATAGFVCDNTPGCIGLIYNISDLVYPTATPVNTTPVEVPSGTSTGNGFGSVFLTPLANETSGDIYASVEAQPNTVWGVTPVGPAGVGSSIGAIVGCYNHNQQTAGSCGGVLIPTYDSFYQKNSSQGGMISGIQYDSLGTFAPSPQFTNAISLTYTTA